MFSNTAYEAMYQYIGLSLHTRFIELITSHKVFVALIVLIFGWIFFMTTLHFFSRYMPGALVRRRFVPLSKYFRAVLCLILGLMILNVGSDTSVKRFNGDSWHDNPYIKGKVSRPAHEHRVSLVFDLLSRTAEESARLVGKVVDSVFKSANSQLEAPNFFFKAIMHAGGSTIEDKHLREAIKLYSEECFDRLIPLIRSGDYDRMMSRFFGASPIVDRKLAEVVLDDSSPRPYTCLDVKDSVRDGLQRYAFEKAGSMPATVEKHVRGVAFDRTRYMNLKASSLLVNTFLESKEGWGGVQKGSQLPTTGSRFWQFLNRIGWKGLFHTMGMPGGSTAISKADEFSEHLARAPHLAGFIKMLLIALFPFLVFFVVAGYWRFLVYWFLIYLSVLLWTPLWTLLYHIIYSINLSADMMAAFGALTDGVSLAGAQLISSRSYYMFAVYSWLQIIIGPVFTGLFVYFLRPGLEQNQGDSAPEFLETGRGAVSATSSVSTAAKAVF